MLNHKVSKEKDVRRRLFTPFVPMLNHSTQNGILSYNFPLVTFVPMLNHKVTKDVLMTYTFRLILCTYVKSQCYKRCKQKSYLSFNLCTYVKSQCYKRSKEGRSVDDTFVPMLNHNVTKGQTLSYV